jgi:8-oxo-dGTP diphosphatase
LAATSNAKGIHVTIYVNARAIIERVSDQGTEVLLQVRSKPGEIERWEFPGGQIDPFESVFAALAREISEESGLTLTHVHGQDRHVSYQASDASVETFEPFFSYQTVAGPVDSLGFYFRCSAEGEIAQHGDMAKEPTWVHVDELRERFERNPGQFDWLTQAALDRYLGSVRDQAD